MPYLKKYKIKNKEIKFPIFLPDATRAVVRSVDSRDLENAGIEGIVVNGYHLSQNPGSSVLEKLGGVKKFMNFDGLVVSDSGGFQALSLIYSNSGLGKISDKGIIFKKGLGGKTKKTIFTPEKSIFSQFSIGSDVMVCLDDCPPKNASPEDLKKSVQRTIDWAQKSKEEFLRQIEKRKLGEKNRPILLGVIQGGKDKKLRQECAEELIKIGFDGYAFGGWPVDPKTGKMDLDALNFTAGLMPKDRLKFALGIGSVEGIIEGTKMGYNFFDCVLPTRDARHKRLYVFSKDPEKINIFEEKEKDFWKYLYIDKEKYYRDIAPISEFCDCHTCRNCSRAYLRHLFEIGDSLAWRLATIHNLRFYSILIGLLRRSI